MITDFITERLKDAWDELDPIVGSGRDLRAFLLQEMPGLGIASFLSFAGFDRKVDRAEDNEVLGERDPVWNRRFKLYLRFPDAEDSDRNYEIVMRLAEYFESDENSFFRTDDEDYSIIILGGNAVGDTDLSIDAFEIDIEVV